MMRIGLAAVAALCASLVLTACNTTDALTPQADVPGATSPAENRTQSTQQTPAAERQPVQADQTQPMPSIDELPPQNTLEAQAQALASGRRNPALTDPGDNPELGANLYKNSESKPAANLYAASQAPTAGSIRFLPIIGAPVGAVTPLSRELGNSARGNGLTIKGSNDQSAEHVLKGYLSAFADGKKVTVVYVWDVLDNSGARLHRIQGQDSVPADGADAWAAVPPELMQEIGVNTIAEYMKWKQSKG